jgi:hypothetical protein
MLQPQKKKLNPAQKTRALTSKTKSKGKAPANYDVDWDAVRSVNDNTAVQAAKMFDPTGLTSWPDVYYAIDDYNKGKGSGWNIALNVLGALPVLGKLGKGAGMLAKSQKLTKVTNKVSKINRIVDKVEKVVPNAAKMIGNTSDAIANASRAGRANPVAVATKVVGKVAKGVEKADTATRKVTGKILDKIPGAQGDIGNLVNAVSSTLNIANTASDVKAVVDASNKNSKPEIKETVKPKVIYYNTDPKRGKVEKPGKEEGVQYLPLTNRFDLEKWKKQKEAEKLAYGTGEDGIDPNKPWFPPSSSIYQDPNFDFLNQTQEPIDFFKPQIESQGFADIGVSKNSGKFNVGSGINFNPESLAARVGASFNDKGFNSALNYTQGERGFSEVNVNADYGNDFIQGEVDYSKTNNGDSLLGNLNIGDDKLRLLLSYLKDSEGTNFKGGFENTTDLKGGLLNSAIELDTNFEDPKISGRVNYTNPTGRLNLNAGASYSEGEKANFNAGLNYSFALGTDKNGIMKSKINPRKKYANGSSAKGMNTNNYIISPAQALADYDIMMAKVEQQAMSNPWLPVVAAVGGAAQSFVGNASNYVKKPGGTIPGITTGGKINAVNDRGVITAMGTNNVQQDVEVEGGEMYETPQGEVGEFQGPSHEQGGIPLEVGQDVEEGTKVYSDRLKIGKKTLAERKETRERQIANLEKIASEPLVDQAIKNSSKRKMMAIQKEEAADLDFQEKVNNIQQMADTMVAAYGTSMAGIQDNPIGESMRYGYGSGMTGVQKYYTGTDDTGIDPPWMLPSSSLKDDPNYVEPMTLQQIQTIIGSNPDGTWGRRDRRKARNFIKDKNQSAFPSWARGGEGITKNQSDMEQALADEGFQKQFRRVYLGEPYSQEELDAQAAEDAEFYVPGEQIGVAKKENPPGTVFSRTLKNIFTGNKDKENKSEGDESEDNPTAMGNMMRGLPGMGDAIKLAGNYLGMTAGIKTANEQRATDVTKTNVYKNAGEESQRLLDNAKKGIEINKAQAIVKANTNTKGGIKSARNSSRGVNQMKALEYLYTAGLNQQIADITAGAAEKMSAIDIQKSGVAMNTDQLKGAGEWQAIMANDADKDAYFTALGLGRKDFATGLQQSGKDINDMKENKIIENLMKNYGKWVGADGKGNLANIKKTSSKEKEQIFLGPDGKTKFKLGPDNKLIEVTV